MKYFVIVFLLASLIVISIPTFAEIMPSTSPLAISTPYNSYISGDKVFVRVDANSNSNVTISMIDPSKNTVKHIVNATDEDGHISTSFILPFYAEQGTWILNATYGVNFDTVSFDVVALQKERMIKDITELEKYTPISVPFSKSDHVLVGTIMQVENVTENTLRYSIDVDFYLKNEQSFDFLTAISDNIQEPIGNSPAENAIISLNSPSFVKGDLVFVYLKNINGQQNILPQSFVIEKNWRSGAPGIVHTDPLKESYESGDEILFAGMVQKSEIYQSAKKDKPFDITLTIYDKQGSEIITKPLDVDANATYQYKLQTTNLPAGKYEYKINFSGGRSGELWTHDFIINSTKHISPLKQIKSGISLDEIQCKENLFLIQKYDGSPACVKPSSIPDLIKRNWTTTKMLLDMPLAQLGKECGHYSHNEFLNRMQNHTLDTLCHDFLIQNALEDKERMLERGYLFDVKEQVWKKNEFPDTMMSISYHYMLNLEAENENTTISKGDFRKEPSYVIIPLGVVIEGNTSLIPEEITVVLGKNNTITWINDDDTAHTFVSDKGGNDSWSTGMIKPGESSSVTFNNTGIFSYHGTPGPWITGTVTVMED